MTRAPLLRLAAVTALVAGCTVVVAPAGPTPTPAPAATATAKPTPSPTATPGVGARLLGDTSGQMPGSGYGDLVFETAAELTAFHRPPTRLVDGGADARLPDIDWATERVLLRHQGKACDEVVFTRTADGRVAYAVTGYGCLRTNNDPVGALYAIPRAAGPIRGGATGEARPYAQAVTEPTPTPFAMEAPTPTPAPD